MPLILSLTGGDLAAGQRQTRTLRSGTLKIGRGADNDWVLADPERYLSKTHCIISAEDGGYVLTDTSANGLHINGASRPTQRDNRVVLSDGDQLRLSSYLISVSEVAEQAPSALHGSRETAGPLDIDPLDDPLGRPPDPGFQHPLEPVPVSSRRGDDPFDVVAARDRRPVDAADDMFRGAAPANAWKGPTQSDHANPLNHAFTTPKASTPATIDDIDFDDLIGDLGPAAVPARTPPAAPPRPASPPPPSPPAPPPAAAEAEDWDLLPVAAAPLRPAAPVAPPPPVPPHVAPPPVALQPVAPPPPAGQGFAEPGERPAARPAAAAGVAPAEAARAAIAAFLAGAGVADLKLDNADPEATLRAIGEVFRVMAGGLREVLMSRAAIKGEMRVEQTMISARNNNALKFSATTDEAVTALLRSRGPGYLAPLAAAQQAFDDIKSHELAVVSGVQTALVALLRRFDPDALEKRLAPGMLDAVLPGSRRARYWDEFRKTYSAIAREAEDDFQAVFGREFAQAYIAQTRKD